MRNGLYRSGRFQFAVMAFACAAVLTATTTVCRAQNGLRQPVYRVANQPEQANSMTAVAKPVEGPVFDLTQRPGDHPLAPIVRVAKQGLREIDENIRDYSCKVTKRERINGELGDHQHMFVRVRHEPFSVYMFFLKPFKGREVLYVDGQRDNELSVLAEGLKRRLGILHLDPNGRLSMDGQKYPITKFGIRNLTTELIQVAEQDMNYGECIVKVNHNVKLDGRPVTRIEVVHPNPRKNFRYNIARIYIDNELRVPVRYSSWMWPERPGEKPPLEEQYTYSNIKINNGYTAQTFSEDNSEIFKK